LRNAVVHVFALSLTLPRCAREGTYFGRSRTLPTLYTIAPSLTLPRCAREGTFFAMPKMFASSHTDPLHSVADALHSRGGEIGQRKNASCATWRASSTSQSMCPHLRGGGGLGNGQVIVTLRQTRSVRRIFSTHQSMSPPLRSGGGLGRGQAIATWRQTNGTPRL
jgi:hypothetical protein